MRIAFDVSPLSHPPTGVGNYIRGTLAGLLEAAAGAHEVVAFAPTSLRGPERIRATLAGLDVETRLWPLPASHAVRTAWTGSATLPQRWCRAVRRAALHHWMHPAQRHGVRATTIHDLVPLRFPEWTTKRTQAMHRGEYTNAARTCDVIFVNSAYTGKEVTDLLGFPADRIRIAPPGVKDVFIPDGASADLEAPYLLTVATL